MSRDLSAYLSSIFEQGDSDSDIEIVAFGRSFHAHRLILKRSDYFRALLAGTWKDAAGNRRFELKLEEDDFVNEDVCPCLLTHHALSHLCGVRRGLRRRCVIFIRTSFRLIQPPFFPSCLAAFGHLATKKRLICSATCQTLQIANALDNPLFREAFLLHLPKYWLQASQFALRCDPVRKIVLSWLETHLYELFQDGVREVWDVCRYFGLAAVFDFFPDSLRYF